MLYQRYPWLTHVLLYSYGQGIAIHVERAAHAEAVTGVSEDQWMAEQGPALGALATSADFPAFGKVIMAVDYDLRLDELFEFGLVRLLDGVAQLIGPQWISSQAR